MMGIGKACRLGPVSAWTDRLEGAALGASAACMVHCLALPIIVTLLPALSSTLSIPESVHLWLLAVAVPMATLALSRGRTVHGRSGPLHLGIAGLASMAAGALLFDGAVAETGLSVLGSSLLAVGHVCNWRWRHGCGC